MPAVSLPLNESETVILDGSGNGTIKMRPDGGNEYWYPDNVSVSAPNPAGGPPNDEAQCKMYSGPKAADQYFVDGSFSGSSGDSSGRFSGYVIGRHADPYIIAVWTGGDPGAPATIRVQGTKELR